MFEGLLFLSERLMRNSFNVNQIFNSFPQDHPEIGDISNRVALRDRLKCNSFDWFLENVYPEKFVPSRNVIGYGRYFYPNFTANIKLFNSIFFVFFFRRVGSLQQNLCLDDLQQDSDRAFKLGVYVCHRPTVTKSQFFSLTNSGVLRTEISCASIHKSEESEFHNIQMHPCNDNDKHNEKWELTSEKQIRHIDTDLCLDAYNLNSQDHVIVTSCHPLSQTQKWKISH